MTPESREWLRVWQTLLLILLVRAAIAALYILSEQVNLAPDEAQYWTWSQRMDWGYYSKPPGIAWQIWLGTKLAGHTEFGVRSMSLVVGTGIAVATFLIAKGSGLRPKAALWAACVIAFCPIGMLSCFLATTDGVMVLVLALATATLASRLTDKRAPNYIVVGLLIGCGALFKWTAFLLWLPIIVSMIWVPLLRSRQVFVGLVISCLAFIPSVIWNIQHDWATFRHVGSQVSGGSAPSSGNPIDFIVAQAGLLSPVFFFLLIAGCLRLVKERRQANPALLFCASVVVLFIGSYTLAAFRQKMQGNWIVFIYPMASVVVAWYAYETVRWGRKALWIGLGVAIISSCIPFGIPILQSSDIAPAGIQIPHKLNVLRFNMGWPRIHEGLLDTDYDHSKHFLFSDTYQMTAVLSFYGPGQEIAYFLNMAGRRRNQYSYWPSMADERVGQTGYFVVTGEGPGYNEQKESTIQHYTKNLSPYFDRIEWVKVYPLTHVYDREMKKCLIFKCVGYNGKDVSKSDSY